MPNMAQAHPCRTDLLFLPNFNVRRSPAGHIYLSIEQRQRRRKRPESAASSREEPPGLEALLVPAFQLGRAISAVWALHIASPVG
uniref:Uncharacterized protein n=1 Tax=Panagrellus redivivus TaxID=6233 RepID=A0A7E4UTI0_PANRE